jgi:hypothetical protein
MTTFELLPSLATILYSGLPFMSYYTITTISTSITSTQQIFRFFTSIKNEYDIEYFHHFIAENDITNFVDIVELFMNEYLQKNNICKIDANTNIDSIDEITTATENPNNAIKPMEFTILENKFQKELMEKIPVSIAKIIFLIITSIRKIRDVIRLVKEKEKKFSFTKPYIKVEFDHLRTELHLLQQRFHFFLQIGGLNNCNNNQLRRE